MTLWLARHAAPVVARGVCYGRLDIAADAQATAQCARRLADALPQGIRARVSPLRRCEQLKAALLGLRPDLSFQTDVRLAEMDFGDWEGRLWSDLPAAELAAWTDDFTHYRAGGHGESVGRFMARVAAAWDDSGLGGDTLWLTHAGVIRAASLIASGQRAPGSARLWPLQAPAHGQWCTLDIPASRRS
jgi:alpha-ribazole phosphatase